MDTDVENEDNKGVGDRFCTSALKTVPDPVFSGHFSRYNGKSHGLSRLSSLAAKQ
jgi:hypothetical protein